MNKLLFYQRFLESQKESFCGLSLVSLSLLKVWQGLGDAVGFHKHVIYRGS